MTIPQPNPQCKISFIAPFYIVIYTFLAIWLLIDGWVNGFSSIYWMWSIDAEGFVFPELVYNLLFTMIGSLLGCAVLGITSFHRYKAIHKTFDGDHLWGFILAPVLALNVGLLTFAILQSGLVVLTHQSYTTEPNSMDTKATLGYLAIGGISGYNWDIFVKKLQELSANIISTKTGKTGGARGEPDKGYGSNEEKTEARIE
ncbi:hypothetical protein [Agarivorans sp. Alg241-V36]|uniref:hypothetical protein n=1 Tax=Agarivorans sp. Alg241-V36 TaxID=2305992 RepID=UPI0019683749|nr:hypothetical protein [Agarivorans sp. Alg241-V36]